MHLAIKRAFWRGKKSRVNSSAGRLMRGIKRPNEQVTGGVTCFSESGDGTVCEKGSAEFEAAKGASLVKELLSSR